ncbi:TPA: hypothetical protein ACGQ50_000834 [Enterobacter cloacae]
MHPNIAEQDSLLLFTLYAFRIHANSMMVEVKKVWDVIAVETNTFRGYPHFYDGLTRLRLANVLHIRYTKNRTYLTLTPHGLELAGAAYNERMRFGD